MFDIKPNAAYQSINQSVTQSANRSTYNKLKHELKSFTFIYSTMGLKWRNGI